MFHWSAVNAQRFFLDKLPGYWIPVLNKVPMPLVLVLDDLRGHLGIIPKKLHVVILKRFVSDKLFVYWLTNLNKVPVHKVFVRDDLPRHLANFRYRLPAFILKCFFPDKSPR